MNNRRIEQSHSAITGNNNEIFGNHNKITGNNNRIQGEHNKITGNNNIVKGDHNKATGNNNTLRGAHCKASGRNNNVEGDHAASFTPEGASHYGVDFNIDDDATESLRTAIENSFHDARENIARVSRAFNEQFNAPRVVGPAAERFPLVNAPRLIERAFNTMPTQWPANIADIQVPPSLRADESTASGSTAVPPLSDEAFDVPDTSDSGACVICLANKAVCMAYPCAQMNFCIKCARELATKAGTERVKCPVCRKPVEKMIRVYS
jgi:hypothetical protein